MQAQNSIQQEMLRRRMPIVISGIVFFSALLLLRVIAFQFPQDPRVVSEFEQLRNANTGRIERFESNRGVIYDRDGEPMAVNTRQYRVGISPNLVSDPEYAANELAVIFDRDALELYNLLRSDRDWVLLGVVGPEAWQQINELDLELAIDDERLQRRFYPQGTLASQIIGFVLGDGEEARGYVGVEGFYNNQLASSIRDQEVSSLPFGVPDDPLAELGRGADMVLTIDRDIQFLVERELLSAVTEYGASGGTIIVMDPRSGDILAMASYPTFDPNAILEIQDENLLRNPAISETYEPGSVFKVLTVAAALETGAITPDWTYYDEGRLDFAGGVTIENWDRRAHGLVDVTGVLVESLNVGAATLSSQAMGWELFYQMMDRFGIGSPTRIDLEGEVSGTLRVPGDSQWSESDLGTNSFGQGVSVTPLQMLVAINAIANDGVMMQPRVLHQMVLDTGEIRNAGTNVLGTPISAQTANMVTTMMVETVRLGLDEGAQLPGYTIAGKTGTAEIPDVLGYRDDVWNMTFTGFLPADDPQVSVLVLIEEPTCGECRWASQVAAPVFRNLVERLVIHLEIPSDEWREAGIEVAGP